MRPSRPVPLPGASALVWHFGGEAEPVTVVEVRDGGRTVLVRGRDDDGPPREFTLRRGTAAFVERGAQNGPVLKL
jgi:hypothetical protein